MDSEENIVQSDEITEGEVEEVLRETNPYTPQDFVKEYQALCEKMGYQIVVNPVWVARDDGTFSTQLQTSIGKLPKKEGN